MQERANVPGTEAHNGEHLLEIWPPKLGFYF